MRDFFYFFRLGLFAMALMVSNLCLAALPIGLSATVSTNLIKLTDSVTYSITATNQSGSLLENVAVSNLFSDTVLLEDATKSQGSIITNGPGLIFVLGSLSNAAAAQMTLTVQPTNTGFLTNLVIAGSSTVTNVTGGYLVVQIITAQADLGVVMTGPIQAVITNDWMTYGVSITNSGPEDAPDVLLTNTLPTGVGLKGLWPTNLSYTPEGSNLIFDFGALSNGGYTNLEFTVQTTNAGVLPFSASVGSPGLLDTNSANNSAGTNVTVINYLTGTLVAFTNSPQTLNFANGTIQQSILVSNAGPTSVPAARVVVTGLANQLFNAVGTNNGNPFVYYSTNLLVGQSVRLWLQYFPDENFPFNNSQLHAFAVPVPNWTAPPATGTSTNINISRILQLANGNVLIEWPAVTNRTYTVVYSDNVLFSNAMIAPPSIVAPANRIQWIDYGPPTTVSAPTNANMRFYRVYQNP